MYLHLQELGLSDNECAYYIALTNFPRATVQEISKKAELPRTTAYGALSELENLGLVSKELEASKSFYSIAGTEAISRLIEKRKEQLLSQEISSKKLIEVLTPLLGKTLNHQPKLKFVEGKENVENLLFDALPKWRESYKRLNHYVMWGYQDSAFVEHYRRWHNFAWQTRNEKEEIKLFSDKLGKEQQKSDGIKKREIRLLPTGFEFPSSIWVHGDYMLLAGTRENPHYAFLIHDINLAANLRAVFQTLWYFSEQFK